MSFGGYGLIEKWLCQAMELLVHADQGAERTLVKIVTATWVDVASTPKFVRIPLGHDVSEELFRQDGYLCRHCERELRIGDVQSPLPLDICAREQAPVILQCVAPSTVGF